MTQGTIVKLNNNQGINKNTTLPMVSVGQIGEVVSFEEFPKYYKEMQKLCGSVDEVKETFLAIKWLNPELSGRNGFYYKGRFEVVKLDNYKA